MKPVILETPEQVKAIIVQKLLELNIPKICFIGQRVSDVDIISDLVPVDLIVGLDYGLDAQLTELKVPIISLEKEINIRKQWYSGELDQLFRKKSIKDKLSKCLPLGSLIVPYASSFGLEKLAKEAGWTILGPAEATRLKFENKIKLFDLKKKLALNNPSIKIVNFGRDAVDTILSSFGAKVVLQKALGSSGTGTAIIRNEQQLISLTKDKTWIGKTVIATKLVSGPTISVNAVVTKKQVVVMAASFQVIGNKETARNEATFSGVDFGAMQDNKKSPEVIKIAKKIGEELRSEGFLGMFNLNLMAEGLIVTDINARFMGSGVLSTQLQLINKEIPLSSLQILTFLGVDFVVSNKMIKKISGSKIGSLIVLHSLENKSRKIKQTLGLSGGINILKKGEFLVTGGVPQKGKFVESEAPLLRLTTRGSVLNKRNLKLSKSASKVCSSIYSYLFD